MAYWFPRQHPKARRRWLKFGVFDQTPPKMGSAVVVAAMACYGDGGDAAPAPGGDGGAAAARGGGGGGKAAAARYSGGGCLLYTSPSPRDRTRSRMPSSA